MKRILIFLILAFIVLVSTLQINNSVKAQSGTDNFLPGQILVKFKDNTSDDDRNEVIKKHNGQIRGRINGIGTLILKVPHSQEESVVNALSKNPKVEYAELDYLATVLDFPTDPPNDPYFQNKQWGLENTGQTIDGQTGSADADIDANEAWLVTSGIASVGPVKVAILDTGIDQDHPDLSAKIDLQKNFSDSSTVDDIYGHGTHVGGIVAAVTNNSLGVASICPDCKLLNIKVLNDNGAGAYSWIANGINYATQNEAKVINMSLGGSARSTTLEKAVNYAWNNGVVLVAAAGNSGNPSKTYPAAYTKAIAVAATDNQDQKASFSSYSAKWVDIAAPGVDIFSTWKDSSSRSDPQPECDLTDC